MGRISRVGRAIISLAISILSILFLYGYLVPFGLSPSDFFGPSFANFFSGANPTTGAIGETGMIGLLGGNFAPLLPGGIVGVIAFMVLSRARSITSAATAPSMPSREEMMRRMNFSGMTGDGRMPSQSSFNAQTSLPPDITRPQFVVLKSYRQGYKNSKEIGKTLAMDKNEVDKETSALKANGYLSPEGRLMSKAIDLLGN
jgi:hypothetical protein